MFNHMVEESEEIDQVFHALSNRTRRGMLRRLSRNACTVGELAAPTEQELAELRWLRDGDRSQASDTRKVTSAS